MNIDLFRDPLALLGGTDLYRAIEEFTRAMDPPADRTPEGYLVDFKTVRSGPSPHLQTRLAESYSSA